MGARFDDLALLQHHDPVRLGNRAEPVRDGQHCAPLAGGAQRVLDLLFRVGVERACCLVQQQDRRVLEQRARNPHALLFTARQLEPTLTHGRVVPVRQTHNEIMDLGGAGGVKDVLFARVVPAIGDVVADRVIEQHGVLRHHADGRVQTVLRHRTHILPIDAQRAVPHIVEAKEQPPDGGFARPGGANDGHGLSRFGHNRHSAQDGPCGVIAKGHVVQLDPARRYLQGARIRGVHHLGGLFQQVEHLAHIHQRLPDLAIDRAEEVQRHGDLDHVGVDHDKVAHRQRAVLHADRGHDHHANQPGRDDDRLAKVQERERVACLERGHLVPRHGRVVARGLALFGAKILDRLEIQQAVDGLLVSVGVLIVHHAPQLHPPFGHREGEPDI